MSIDINEAVEAAPPDLGKTETFAGFALIGMALATVFAIFAYFGGWFTPGKLTPTRFADGFEKVNGIHAGFRRNHAKGLGVSGFFESNGGGVRLSKALVFREGRVPVLGRFSLNGGQPYVGDTPEAVRGLGLEFSLPDGELWRTAMVNLPVFPVQTPEAFYELILASKPDTSTGKPDPAKMGAFFGRHPEAARTLATIKSQPFSSGFDNSTFRSLNAFRFTNAAGVSTPVRWTLTPSQRFEPAAADSVAQGKNYLFDGLIAQIDRQPLHWHLMIVVAQPGDPTKDASIPWPVDREQVDVGTLTLDRVEGDDTSAARDINFDPLVLPAGMAPSDDPVLSARSAVYSQSYTRRAGEAKQPSAISPADARKGN
jgi:catalase